MFRTLPLDLVARAISANLAEEEKTRRQEMQLNKDYYYDKQEQSITLLNDDQIPTVLNVLKPIVRKKTSLLYSLPPTREMEGPDVSINFLSQVFKDNNINQLLLQTDRMAELTGSGLLLPLFDDKVTGGIKLHLYDASNVTVLADEDFSNNIEAISVVQMVDRLVGQGSEKDIERVLKQQIWTVDKIYNYENNILFSEEPNPFGFIPFVNFKGEDVYEQYLGHSPARGLRLLNESINTTLTDFGLAIKFQSFTPIALTGTRGDTVVAIHPGRALNLPSGAEAKVLQTNPKLSDVLEYVKYLEEKAYELNNVPKVSVVGGGNSNSGRELMIRWFPLLKVFEEKAIRWQQYEEELAARILEIAELPPLDTYKVTYNQSSILPISQEDDTIEQDISLGIKTPAEELMRRNPELTLEEAEIQVLANKQYNSTLEINRAMDLPLDSLQDGEGDN